MLDTGEVAQDGLAYFQQGRTAQSVAPELVQPRAPAVIMTDPKFPHNVGQALRICSCYGVEQLWLTGNRVKLSPSGGYRLPREERMRGYRDVTLFQYDRPFEVYRERCVSATFVSVEVRDNAEDLALFEHPDDAVYVFGPEDGSLGRPTLSVCHRHVVIDTRHCLNLATAIGTVLYDRAAKIKRRAMGCA